MLLAAAAMVGVHSSRRPPHPTPSVSSGGLARKRLALTAHVTSAPEVHDTLETSGVGECGSLGISRVGGALSARR